MVQLSSLLVEFERFWPARHAEEWDRVGLVTGSGLAEIQKVLVAVDLSDSVIDEAIEKKAQLILTHHPLILKPIDSVAEDKLKGKLLSQLIRSAISAFSAHTNADVQLDGASTLMAREFGLVNLVPLVSSPVGFGHGVIGELNNSMSLQNFAELVAETLPAVARSVAFAGNPDREIRKVAICSGAGDSFIPAVLASDVDVFVTSDLRHHPTQDAISTPRSAGPLALIDVAHWAAESLWVTAAVERIESLGTVTAVASNINTDPWTREVKRNA